MHEGHLGEPSLEPTPKCKGATWQDDSKNTRISKVSENYTHRHLKMNNLTCFYQPTLSFLLPRHHIDNIPYPAASSAHPPSEPARHRLRYIYYSRASQSRRTSATKHKLEENFVSSLFLPSSEWTRLPGTVASGLRAFYETLDRPVRWRWGKRRKNGARAQDNRLQPGVITYLPLLGQRYSPPPKTTPARRRAIMQGPSGCVHYGRQDAQDIEVGTDTPRSFFVAVILRSNTRPRTEPTHTHTHTSLPKQDLTGPLPACLPLLALWALCSCLCSRPKRKTAMLGRP